MNVDADRRGIWIPSIDAGNRREFVQVHGFKFGAPVPDAVSLVKTKNEYENETHAKMEVTMEMEMEMDTDPSNDAGAKMGADAGTGTDVTYATVGTDVRDVLANQDQSCCGEAGKDGAAEEGRVNEYTLSEHPMIGALRKRLKPKKWDTIDRALRRYEGLTGPKREAARRIIAEHIARLLHKDGARRVLQQCT